MACLSRRTLGIVLSLLGVLSPASCIDVPVQGGPDLPTWEFGEPSLILGARNEGPTAFSPVRSVAVGPRSELHVLLPQDHEIRAFDENGDFLGSLGSEGDGPGEFNRPTGIGFVGDTLWVLDPAAQRVTFFYKGEFVGTLPVPQLEEIHAERYARVAGVAAGPRLVVSTDSRTPFQPAETTDPGLLLTFSDGTLDTLTTTNVDHVGGFLVKRAQGVIAMMRPFPQPFSVASEWAVSSDGSSLVVVGEKHLAEGHSSYAVEHFSASGELLFSVTHDYEPIAVPEVVIDSLLAQIRVEGFSEAEVREAAYLPETYPPTGKVLVAENGLIWIAREAIPGQPRRWQILSEEGAVVAKILAPLGFDIQWVGAEAAWGLVLDELDVPYLVKRPIHR